VTINGYTQPGAKPNTAAVGTNAVLKIQLDGTSNAESSDGLHVHAPHTAISGLAIGRFQEGIQIHRPFNQSGAHYARVTGCFIGTDASGTQARPNQTGIEVHTSHVSIGGDRIGSRNLISGNAGAGILFTGEAETGGRVLGNLIGTDSTGAARLSNDGDGVSVVSGSGNLILSNAIAGNGELGIDLNDDGPTPNDADDADGGANSTQNKPVISSAKVSDGTISIEGKLTSTPEKTFAVQFFSNPSGNEGKTFLAQRSVTTNANGNAPISFSFARAVPEGQRITATATDPSGNTSEFSPAREVERAGAIG
jgi:hypothetical protein